jgi:hypothetical protein
MTGVAYNSPHLLGVTPRPPVQLHAKPAISPSLGGHCSWVHYKIVHIARSRWIALIIMIYQPA